MLEIESKILNINKEEVIEKLEKMNYKSKRERKLISLLYDTKENSIVKRGGIVRLRLDGERGFLTIKKPANVKGSYEKVKVLEEEECEINFEEKEREFRETHVLLLKTEKERITYEFDRCVIEIDTYLGDMSFIPSFMEIEGENEEVILRRAKELGFSEKDLEKLNTFDLIQKYKPKTT